MPKQQQQHQGRIGYHGEVGSAPLIMAFALARVSEIALLEVTMTALILSEEMNLVLKLARVKHAQVTIIYKFLFLQYLATHWLRIGSHVYSSLHVMHEDIYLLWGLESSSSYASAYSTMI